MTPLAGCLLIRNRRADRRRCIEAREEIDDGERVPDGPTVSLATKRHQSHFRLENRIQAGPADIIPSCPYAETEQ